MTLPARMALVRRNSVDGEEYNPALVDEGLYVCSRCKHAYMEDCGNCHAERPSEEEIANQWSEPMWFDFRTGKSVEAAVDNPEYDYLVSCGECGGTIFFKTPFIAKYAEGVTFQCPACAVVKQQMAAAE